MGLFDKKHSVGKTIATLRKEKGWTQVELAEKLQDFQTIRDLMNDEGTRVWVRGRGAYEIVL